MTVRILCFGEMMFRLTAPGRELLLQSARFDVNLAGAESNVAIGLASLGHGARMAGVLPDNPLGEAAISELRRRAIDCSGILRRAGRMGLFFLTPGAGLRPSEILYDRTHSAFADTPADVFDWPALLEGMAWLHLSGVTPALGPASAAAALGAAEAARAAGVKVSFDGNYRAKLWEAWDSDPRAVLSRLVGLADIFFGNHQDVSLLTGVAFDGEGEQRRRQAAETAFIAFPNLKHIASTARHVEDADRHRISARIDTPTGHCQTEEVLVAGIVDRIGAGDAFAAGVLHGLITGQSEQEAVHSGLALTCLKHSLPGDVSLFTRDDIATFQAGNLDVRR